MTSSDEISSEERFIKKKYSFRQRKALRWTVFGGLAGGLMYLVGAVGEELTAPLPHENPYRNDPIVKEYDETVREIAKIEKSITLFERMKREAEIPYLSEDLSPLIDEVFSEREKRERGLTNLIEEYSVALVTKQGKIVDLGNEPEFKKYKNWRAEARASNLYVPVTFGGTSLLFLTAFLTFGYDAIRTRRLDGELKALRGDDPDVS